MAAELLETGAAVVACTVIASAPLVAGVLVGALSGGLVGLVAFGVVAAAVVVVVVPALTPMPSQPQLDGYARWGTRVGTAVRAPIAWQQARSLRRAQRALGALSSSSSAAAPSLGPHR